MLSELRAWEGRAPIPALGSTGHGGPQPLKKELGGGAGGEARGDETQGQRPLSEDWPICGVRAWLGVRVRAGSEVTLGTHPGVNVRTL